MSRLWLTQIFFVLIFDQRMNVVFFIVVFSVVMFFVVAFFVVVFFDVVFFMLCNVRTAVGLVLLGHLPHSGPARLLALCSDVQLSHHLREMCAG